MSEWQPIETAPKNGTIVDLWGDGRRYADAIFGYDSWNRGPMWVFPDQSDGYVIEVDNPTHWMPLPEPPK